MIDLKGFKLFHNSRLRYVAAIYELKRQKDNELYWVWAHRYVSTRATMWFEKDEVLKLAKEGGLLYLGELSHLDEVVNNDKYKESDLMM